MPHFFIPPGNISGKTFFLTGETVHYLTRVRRVAPGDTLQLFDGTGKIYRAKVTGIDASAITGIVLEEQASQPPQVLLRLFQSVPKGERFDWLVEKCAEIGVRSLAPMITARSVVKEISPAKVERWRRLSRAACQQSGRTDLMAVEDPVLFRDALKVPGGAANIIPWEGEDAKTIDDVFMPGALPGEVNLFIGPEGGFAFEEINFARDHGAVAVTVGPRILRSETAGILAAILVLDRYGEFGKGRE